MRRLRLGMAQVNTTVGDFSGNTEIILKYLDKARALKVDLVTFPELALCGYPPEDLLLKPQFIEENLKTLERVVQASRGIAAVIGFVDADGGIYNAAAVICNGKLVGKYHKILLPNYGVFDEYRYFRPGSECPVYTIGGVGVGVTICEDMWQEIGPDNFQARAGAGLIINISASPYHMGKGSLRKKLFADRARDNLAVLAYNNLVGGQDELVFDGDSFVLDEKGEIIARGRQFEEDLIVADLDIEAAYQSRLHDPGWQKKSAAQKSPWHLAAITVSEAPPGRQKPSLPTREVAEYEPTAEVYHALVLGTGDYIRKNGFARVLIGLSGGIDSSLVAAIATEALGAGGVVGVAMPSRYSSASSLTDARQVAQNLGIELLTVPIEAVFSAYLKALAPFFAKVKPDTTEENIQARIRGNLLMALSNKFGWLVLTTGNKSEMATGYTTLYGDMAGGFAVIKDVPKTLVYQLCRYLNQRAGGDLIPKRVMDKAPSAELRPNQKDSDSLPLYEQLDPVLTAYVEEDKSVEQIVAMGFSEAVVKKTARLVDTSEYKRRQSPPGIKITPRAFGRDRRLPITNRFHKW
ncbi:MAG: NAD+ synthase [Chloroflexota bacterium]